MNLEFLRLHPEATPPVRMYEQSAAWDISALCKTKEGLSFTKTIAPNGTQIISTGLALRAPPRHYLLIASRSGLATRGVFVTNAPGVIDPDYTGEIKVILTNAGMEPHYVRDGDRIAQVLILPLVECGLHEITILPTTERASRGFGSTGS